MRRLTTAHLSPHNLPMSRTAKWGAGVFLLLAVLLNSTAGVGHWHQNLRSDSTCLVCQISLQPASVTTSVASAAPVMAVSVLVVPAVRMVDSQPAPTLGPARAPPAILP
jgi:hypothetical protein